MRNNKKRADAYFGVHVDFHAVKNTENIGAYTIAENIGRYLDEIKPDYLQIDTKGHPGYASFFTQFGETAPGLMADHLKIIREETEKRGISLIAHHSALWDEAACASHPEWAIIEEDGSLSDKYIDCTTDYTDKRFIPMLKELCENYGFDGAWIDGDCWCVYENYRPEFVNRFLNSSEFDSIDKESPDSPSHIAFRKFCKQEFAKFVKYYCTEIKKEFPDFEITSNNAFSAIYPEKTFDEVDFNSIDIFELGFRTHSRCYASGNKPWDMMSWGHPVRLNNTGIPFLGLYACNNHTDRTKRIAANAISLGGGFQIIGMMTPQGEIMMYDIPVIKEMHDFLMERKAFNYRSVPLKNAAVWLSQENTERTKTTGMICDFNELSLSLCDLVVDAGYPVDVVFDFHIKEGKIKDHPVIIIPEHKYISPESKAKLLQYAENGGNLIVTGANSCKQFAELVDANMTDYVGRGIFAATKDLPQYLVGSLDAVIFENYNGEELCTCFGDKQDINYRPVKATAVVEYGEGKVVFIGWDIINSYFERKFFLLPEIMKIALKKAVPAPRAYLSSGTNRVEIIPAQKDDMLLVNVINTTEYYYLNDKTSFGEIPPLHNIEIAVLCKKEPRSVMLEPEHRAAKFTYDGKYAYVKIDILNIHTIITIRF